jgi:hypothetical protein
VTLPRRAPALLRWAPTLAGLLLAACAEDLLPGETVLLSELPAEVVYGAEDSRFGEVLAARDGRLAAAAPGLPGVWVEGAWSEGNGQWVGWQGDALVRVGLREAVIGELAAPELSLGARFAATEGAVYFATDRALRRYDGASVEVVGIEALAASPTRVVALVCAEACALRAWDAELGAELATPDLPAGEGGALSLDDDVLCAGDPELDQSKGAGRVECEDGRAVEGIAGDHLGLSIGGGHAAGLFNKHDVPERGRLVPLAGGEVLVVEGGAVSQPLRVAGGEGWLFVGSPFQTHAGGSAGAVFTVALP